MLTQDEFLEMLDDIAGELPLDFFEGLNGGVLMQLQAKPHPQSENDELWILGEYCNSYGLGRYINIYYGSFMQVYGYLPKEALREKVRHTLVHEFRHHLEARAGQKDLEIIDAVNLARYKQQKQKKEDN